MLNHRLVNLQYQLCTTRTTTASAGQTNCSQTGLCWQLAGTQSFSCRRLRAYHTRPGTMIATINVRCLICLIISCCTRRHEPDADVNMCCSSTIINKIHVYRSKKHWVSGVFVTALHLQYNQLQAIKQASVCRRSDQTLYDWNQHCMQVIICIARHDLSRLIGKAAIIYLFCLMQLLPAEANIMCTCQTLVCANQLVCLNHLAQWAVCILQYLVLPQLASSSAEQPLKQQLHGSPV